MNLPDKDPEESVVVEFDFSNELTGIDSVVLAVSSVGGIADPTPATLLQGTPQITGATVLQRIRGGVSGARYKLRAVAVRGDDIVALAGVLSVRTI